MFLADLLEEEDEEEESGAGGQQTAAEQGATQRAPAGQHPAPQPRTFANSTSLAGSAAAAAEAAAAEAAAMVDAAQAAEAAALADIAATTQALEAAEAAAAGAAAAGEGTPSEQSAEPAVAGATAQAAAPADAASEDQAAAIAAAAAALEKAAAAAAAGKQQCPVRRELDAAAPAQGNPVQAEQVAAALNRLLNNIGEELATVGKQLVPPGLRGEEERQRLQGGSSRSRRPGLLRHQREPVAAEQRMAGASRASLQPQSASKLTAAAAGAGSSVAALSPGAYGRHPSLPFPSPFESGTFDPAASLVHQASHQPSLSPGEAAAAAATAPVAIPGARGGASGRTSASGPDSSSAPQSLPGHSPGPASLAAGTPSRAPVGFSAPNRRSELSRGPGAGAPLQHTSNVWAGFRQKLAEKPIDGVRFVSVPAGTTIDVGRTRGSVCLLVESGESLGRQRGRGLPGGLSLAPPACLPAYLPPYLPTYLLIEPRVCLPWPACCPGLPVLLSLIPLTHQPSPAPKPLSQAW